MKITPKAKAGPRLYMSDRGPVPSVSDVLGVVHKPWLDEWRSKDDNRRKMHNASVLGTRVHAIVKSAATGRKWRIEPELEPYAEAVRGFLGMHVAECLAFELPLVSHRLGFGGTLDLYCRMTDGSFAVIDWKTTRSLTREHGLQVAAYAALCREHGMKVNKRIVVRIKKEAPGLFYARTYADHRGDMEAFLALKTYWHWAHKSKLEVAA